MGDCTAAATLITTPSTLLASLVAVAVIGYVVSLWGTAKPVPAKKRVAVPFLVLHDPDWGLIGRSMQRYEGEVTSIMNGLSQSLEVARTSEWELFGQVPQKYLLSHQLQRRIDRLALLFEQNTKLLQDEILKEFPLLKTLPDKDACFWKHQARSPRAPPPLNQPPHRVNKLPVESSSYDSASQVMAHITRDWTKLGRSVRERTYDWCRDKLGRDLNHPIMVPGAGLGRLAYDLACNGYSVEANDSSILMASAAHAILQKNVQGTLYPFAMDFFTNEVENDWRYKAVRFPDVDIQDMRGSLSYTIGDFTETYSTPHVKGRYGGIVTCFFLDTATNIYEYLSIIQNVLRDGGVWVNVGPLQWHRNSVLHPSADELKGLVESAGFRISHWSVDAEAMDYRFEDETFRSTKYEAFKPLRMVAIKGKSRYSK